MNEPFIALIEDDEDDIALMTECFKRLTSYPIKNFTSAQEFLDYPLNGSLPCLCVIDLNLPAIKGLDLVEHIKLNSALADVPIIIYTTDYTDRDKTTCEELKVRLLKKPDTFPEWEKMALIMVEDCNGRLQK